MGVKFGGQEEHTNFCLYHQLYLKLSSLLSEVATAQCKAVNNYLPRTERDSLLTMTFERNLFYELH